MLKRMMIVRSDRSGSQETNKLNYDSHSVSSSCPNKIQALFSSVFWNLKGTCDSVKWPPCWYLPRQHPGHEEIDEKHL